MASRHDLTRQEAGLGGGVTQLAYTHCEAMTARCNLLACPLTRGQC